MTSKKDITCFKAYDIRGKLGKELNEDIAYKIGRSTAQLKNAKTVVVGFDARASSPYLARAISKGICDGGADVLDIGLAGTEEMYAAVTEFGACAGVEVTASHNPINYNGMKIVGCNSKPLSDREFKSIRELVQDNSFFQRQKTGAVLDKKKEAREAYIKKVLSFVDCSRLKPSKL